MKRRCGPEGGDNLISCSGTIGRITVVPSDFECVLVCSAALAKLDREKAYGFYIQFWHQSNQAQGQVFSSVNQGAQPNLLRDKDQVEVDLVITRGRQVWGVEVKAAVTVTPADGQGLRRLASQERTSSSTQPTARAPL